MDDLPRLVETQDIGMLQSLQYGHFFLKPQLLRLVIAILLHTHIHSVMPNATTPSPMPPLQVDVGGGARCVGSETNYSVAHECNYNVVK